MIKQNWMLFRKTKQCFLVSIIMPVIWLGLIIYVYIATNGHYDVTVVLRESIRLGKYIFIMFLFLSYEYLSLAGRYHIEECINTTKVSGIVQRGYQIGILLTINLIYYICIYIVNIIICVLLHIYSLNYIIYIGKTLVIYFLLTNAVAILLGSILSFLNRSGVAYAILILIGLAALIRAEQSLYYIGYKETLHGLSDFNQIFCVSDHWVLNQAYFHPTELHFWVKPVYFIAFLTIVFLLLCFSKTRNKKFLYFTAAPVICGIACVYLWSLPCDGSYAGYADYEEQVYASEQKLLSDPEPFDEFYVVSYDMELDLRNVLKADIVMTLSDPSLEQYDFTFCGVYPIERIEDGNGNTLNYRRKGNRFTVMNDTGNLETIHMVYEGAHLNRYYTGKGGSYLPGNFPYYPIAGTGDVYAVGLCALPEQESFFKVVVKNHMEVYTNLEETEQNVFTGYSNQATLVSGEFWMEKTIDGVDYIYPYICIYKSPELNTDLYEEIQKYLNHKVEDAVIDYTLDGKKILIDPAEAYTNYMFGSDMVMIADQYDLEHYYTHYLQTGDWYSTEGIMSDEELRKWLEENGAGEYLEDPEEEDTGSYR